MSARFMAVPAFCRFYYSSPEHSHFARGQKYGVLRSVSGPALSQLCRSDSGGKADIIAKYRIGLDTGPIPAQTLKVSETAKASGTLGEIVAMSKFLMHSASYGEPRTRANRRLRLGRQHLH